MLKSKFNIAGAHPAEDDEEEDILEENINEEGADTSDMAEHHEATPRPPDKILDKSDVAIRLSMLGKTADGDGYTYLKATITGLALTNINVIKYFRHLQFVDVSNNHLDLEALQVVTELPYLVLIQADENGLQSAALKRAKYLQVVIMNNNNITSIHDVYQPELSTLEVANNRIQKIQFDSKMPNIKCLDFNHNALIDIAGVDFPLLDSLYLAANRIKSLEGLEKLVNLRLLHLRNNPLRLLDGFSTELKKLTYLNLRNCKVSTLRQVKKLRDLPALETLVMKGCPYMGGTGEEDAEVAEEEEDPELRVEVIAIIPRLKRLNKQVITPEERGDANELIKQWAEEGEKEDEEEVVEELGAEEQNNED